MLNDIVLIIKIEYCMLFLIIKIYISAMNSIILERNAKIGEAGKATRLRRKGQVCKVYKCKIDVSSLTLKQKEQLKMMFVESKWIYNDIIRWSKEEGHTVFDYKLKSSVVRKDKDMNDVEQELSWTSSHVRQEILQQTKNQVKTLSTLKRRGKKVGEMKFLSEYNTVNLKQYNNTWKRSGDKHLHIQGVKGNVRVNGLKQIPSDVEYANAKICSTPLGYYIAITTYTDTKKKEEKKDIVLGVDFGCSTSFTTSEGKKINSFVEESGRLKALQCRIARQKKGSNRRRKNIYLLRREYQKMNNKKNDLANKIAHYLLSYKKVVIQDEQLQSWKTEHGTKVQHSVLGRVKSILQRKDNVIILNKWLPTTKVCTQCGTYHNMSLKDRVFRCDCGIEEDRDIHAAKTIVWLYEHKIGLGQAEYKHTQIEEEIRRATSSYRISKLLSECEGATL